MGSSITSHGAKVVHAVGATIVYVGVGLAHKASDCKAVRGSYVASHVNERCLRCGAALVFGVNMGVGGGKQHAGRVVLDVVPAAGALAVCLVARARGVGWGVLCGARAGGWWSGCCPIDARGRRRVRA